MYFWGRDRRLTVVMLLLVVVSLFNTANSYASHDEACSSAWYVTGYFTPVESDYPQSDKTKINIERLGASTHASAFLRVVMIEGWGRTKDGWYLGRFSNKWHKSNNPLNALGKPLNVGSIATDKNIIPTGVILKIPSLPNALKDQIYISDDVGSAIKSTHVDIYTGEGKLAEKVTYEITGKDHIVCRLTPI